MLTPTTELDALNTMLSVIGESPVNTVEDTGLVDAVLARSILRNTSREVQSRGWHFNTEKGYPLTPDFEGSLVIPFAVLRVDSVGAGQDVDVVVRGARLYDRRNHTYSFNKELKADMVILLPFEELPEPARHYITVRAARIFQQRIVGSEVLSGFNERDELQARMVLLDADLENGDYNILSDHYDVARVLDR